MRYLVIDAGNSFLKIGEYQEDKLQNLYQYPNDDLTAIYHDFQGLTFDGCIISAVKKIPLHIEKYLVGKCRYKYAFGDESDLPFKIKYKTKSTLGRDRIALVAGAMQLRPNDNNLIISMGTCITYNFMDAKNTFRGGSISPGMEMRFKAMHSFTEQLPKINYEEISPLDLEKFIGTDTKENMISGVIQGIIGEISLIVSLYRKKYPQMNVIITGGNSDYFIRYPEFAQFLHSPTLMMDGLKYLLQSKIQNIDK